MTSAGSDVTRKRIGVPRERRLGERRVAATPETVTRLRTLGFDLVIESDAGAGASFGDDDYRASGATIVDDPRDPPAASPDPDDDYLIALARVSGADYLVSGDRHLLDLEKADPPVLTHATPVPRPAEYVNRARRRRSRPGGEP